ncbi:MULTISPECIES: Occludin/ELL family protein [unclassified Synechococcus]|jgi:hypothetical protein|uniref:Occludin/ELL family protein n=1 Tax=unclassified Synechococcus TaxID=2626047 RepID=UPI0020CFD4F3|nr:MULTISPECIES: Occludin/ELL family protein [unclassified Synechococcus]
MAPSVGQLFAALALPAGAVALAALQPLAVAANPVVCTTTLEAPMAGGATSSRQGLVEVTRCGPVTTTPQLVERRFFTYTSPYARGVDITHQITDLLGIAMGGGDGTKVMGLGFPDQTIVWDGSALQNTYAVLLEQQSNPLPWRTADVSNGFCAGLAAGGCGGAAMSPAPVTSTSTIRGLW